MTVRGQFPLRWRGAPTGGRECVIIHLLSILCHSRLVHPTNTFVFAGTPGAGMTRKCGRTARRHIALDCHSRTPTFSTLIVLRTEIKNARWALFISGADDRSPALDNSCPTSYCSRLRAHHSLELACTYVWLVYSYANRGSNPDPSKVIKTPAKRGRFNNWGG